MESSCRRVDGHTHDVFAAQELRHLFLEGGGIRAGSQPARTNRLGDCLDLSLGDVRPGERQEGDGLSVLRHPQRSFRRQTYSLL
ncbi:hypothetical protein ACFFX0_29490 [Citricoccus parietis]|uniref:Uncharacterized protein n=1 Tax=Citricoccus parietis TaxID=592307 RepID=A0ABV5FXY8_9MICC